MFFLRVWMLGKQDQKNARVSGDEEEEKGDVEAEQVLGEPGAAFMHRWRNANRWWRYAKV